MIARALSSLQTVPPSAWDALHDGRNPFVSHAFLAGLEAHGCLRADWGWTPHHLTLWDGEALIAAAPGYLKTNSHGEFVFDHAWARAYAHYGRDYYPKWVCAVPYSPVTGPRLLARDPAAREALIQAMPAFARAAGASSAHVNFHDADEDAAFGPEWLPRRDVQYHWRNEDGWRDFGEFLAAMDHKHRKNIRQERAKVARAGITFRVVHGDEATDADLAAMHRFYLRTFADYGNSPALTLDFLRHLARTMPRSLVLILAGLDGETIAGALCLRGGDTLYGRYWGASRTLPGLHFETCYYQGIDYCLREGLTWFEPGAQGEHKIDRGFLPAFVRSRHWLADADFTAALSDWCREEVEAASRYAIQLAHHSPFRTRPRADGPRLPWLDADPSAPFPPPTSALRAPEGLLAAGGDLQPQRLLNAYRQGIFPWYGEGEPILWWSPDPRTVFRTDHIALSRRDRRALRGSGWVARADTAFDAVLDACARMPRPGQAGTWITADMQEAYRLLHRLGHAHSVEVFDRDGALVGGIYGVAVGRMFFGESMVSLRSGGSKAALAALAAHLHTRGWPLIDAQVSSPHLLRLGAETWPRPRFLEQVAGLTAMPEPPGAWTAAFGDWPLSSLPRTMEPADG